MNPGVWIAFLTNFLFWTGTAAGAVAFAALLELTNARWAGPLRVTAERFRRFLPVSIALYAVLLAGTRAIYPWIEHPTGSRWLQFTPFAARDLAALAAIAAAAYFQSPSSRARPQSPGSGRGASVRGAVLFLLVYAVGFSILAIDLVMSLDAPWGSTLFPAYVFTANLYAAIAAVAIASRWSTSDAAWVMTDERACDVGNLLLGLALVWMYLVWSQFLVIWYGNLTEEVGYLSPRLYGHWRPLAWTVWFMRFTVPIVVLLPRAGKRPKPVSIAAAVIVLGFWAECFLLVVPSAPAVPSPWSVAVMTAGFGILFTATIMPRREKVRSRELVNW